MKNKNCVEYEVYEANIVVGLSLYVASNITKLNKSYEKHKIDIKTFIERRKKYHEAIYEFKQKIEEIDND